MRNGAEPRAAARKAINRIAQYYPKFFGAVITVNRKGQHGAACNGMAQFDYWAASPTLGGPKLFAIKCSNFRQ